MAKQYWDEIRQLILSKNIYWNEPENEGAADDVIERSKALAKTYRKQAQALFFTLDDYDQAEGYFRKLVEAGRTKEAALVSVVLAICYPSLGGVTLESVENAIGYLDKAKALFQECGDISMYLACLSAGLQWLFLNMSMVARQEGDQVDVVVSMITKLSDEAHQGYMTSKTWGDGESAAAVLLNLSRFMDITNVYSDQKSVLDEAFDYAKKAVTEDSDVLMGLVYQALGAHAFFSDRYADAKELFEMSKDLLERASFMDPARVDQEALSNIVTGEADLAAIRDSLRRLLLYGSRHHVDLYRVLVEYSLLMLSYLDVDDEQKAQVLKKRIEVFIRNTPISPLTVRCLLETLDVYYQFFNDWFYDGEDEVYFEMLGILDTGITYAVAAGLQEMAELWLTCLARFEEKNAEDDYMRPSGEQSGEDSEWSDDEE